MNKTFYDVAVMCYKMVWTLSQRYAYLLQDSLENCGKRIGVWRRAAICGFSSNTN